MWSDFVLVMDGVWRMGRKVGTYFGIIRKILEGWWDAGNCL